VAKWNLEIHPRKVEPFPMESRKQSAGLSQGNNLTDFHFGKVSLSSIVSEYRVLKQEIKRPVRTLLKNFRQKQMTGPRLR
jgi:hypothetical protein